jgi:hypothetical protein
MVAAVNVNALIAAVDAALTAEGVPFGDSNRPADLVQDRPYVVGFTDGGMVTDRSLVGRDGVVVSLLLQTYGYTPDSVRVGRKKAIDAVYGLAGTTQGTWRVRVPVHTASLPIEREDKLSPPLYWQTDDFTISLTPA